MLNIFKESWQELDHKINELENGINYATGLLGSYDRNNWERIFNTCKEIHQDFKSIRYPTKLERDSAWQRFFNLRNSAYVESNKLREQDSRIERDDLYGRLNSLEYDWFSDFLVGHFLSFGIMKTRAEEMKWAGKKLKEVGQYFSTVKYRMTKEHKAEVFQRIVKIRETHDAFWSQYKERSQEEYRKRKEQNQQVWEEKQRAWEEKKEQSSRIRDKIESNLEGNKEKLKKAINALDRCQDSRGNLQDKIYESYSDNWKSKAEGWLDELDDKIGDIESSINRIKDWIAEDKNKLDNWD